MYSTDDLVQRAVQALRKMQKVEAAKVSFTTAELSVTNAGVWLYPAILMIVRS
jgi:hypothetical protein